MEEKTNKMPGRNGGQLKRGDSPGRPRKMVSSVVAELAEKGIVAVTALEVQGVYKSLLQLTEGELKDMVADKDSPMLIRIVAKGMLDKKGFEVIEKMMDRAHGRPANVLSLQRNEDGQSGQPESTVVTGINFIIVGGEKPPITNEGDLPTM